MARVLTAEEEVFLLFYDEHRDDAEYRRELERRMQESETFRKAAECMISIADDPDLGAPVARTDDERAEATFRLGEEHARAVRRRLGPGYTTGMYYLVHDMRVSLERAAAAADLDPGTAREQLVRDTFAIASHLEDAMDVMPYDVAGTAAAARALRAEPSAMTDFLLRLFLTTGKKAAPTFRGARVRLQASERMDVATLVDHVLGTMSHGAEEAMWRRVQSDRDFRLRAHFVFAAWSVPHRSEEVIREAGRRRGAGDGPS